MSRLNSCIKKFLLLICLVTLTSTMSYMYIFHHATLGNIPNLSNGKIQITNQKMESESTTHTFTLNTISFVKINVSILVNNQFGQFTAKYYDLELVETTTKLNSRIIHKFDFYSQDEYFNLHTLMIDKSIDF